MRFVISKPDKKDFQYALLISTRYAAQRAPEGSDLENRMDSHNIYSKKGYTAKFMPWALVYSEAHPTKEDAMKREKALKSSRGREFIWKIIEEKYNQQQHL